MYFMTSPWPPHDYDAPPAPPAMPPPAIPPPATTGWTAYHQWPAQSPPWNEPVAGGPRRRADYGIQRDLPVALLIVLTLAVAGVLCGFLWHAVSARPHVIEGAGGSFQLPADTDKNYFGAEAAFLAVTAAAGLLTGLAVWQLGRRRGPAIPVATALGSAAGGVVTRAVGEAQQTNATLARVCGKDRGYDAICQVYNGHLHLRVAGLTLTWAIAALAVFLILSLIAARARARPAQWQSPGEASEWEPPWQPPAEPSPWQQPAWQQPTWQPTGERPPH
jgi:hypothetical protein